MTEEASIDATDMPDLLRAAERVRATNQPIVVRSGGQDVALITPLAPRGPTELRRPTPEQVERALSAIGMWKDRDDIEELKAEWRAARGSNRPPIDLHSDR